MPRTVVAEWKGEGTLVRLILEPWADPLDRFYRRTESPQPVHKCSGCGKWLSEAEVVQGDSESMCPYCGSPVKTFNPS